MNTSNITNDNPKDCFCERHRINIPTLGWVRLKEKGYILLQNPDM